MDWTVERAVVRAESLELRFADIYVLIFSNLNPAVQSFKFSRLSSMFRIPCPVLLLLPCSFYSKFSFVFLHTLYWSLHMSVAIQNKVYN
ncbi:hypothetical protein SAMN02745108_02418 [Fibrobacter intestinalis]|uniref:Uncharacterized protein n=1 Tax=Fibrobacter intestinalis TaxID=28122 RepID=A0A1T4QUP6_9BACT|nr:hypothetical protein BGW94_2249 [Fibrobacter sp. NR9]SKA07529.1 hypothetical protein SAMN02745108_02418 [Fibrobacter intestinalis]